jgi:hypothetical protein
MYSYTDTDKVPVDRREVQFHDQYQRFLVTESRAGRFRLHAPAGQALFQSTRRPVFNVRLTGIVDIQRVVFHD